MSKKVLHVEGIMNELEGASLFFKSTSQSPPPTSPPPQPQSITGPEPETMVKPESSTHAQQPQPADESSTSLQSSVENKFRSSNKLPQYTHPKTEKTPATTHDIVHARTHASNRDKMGAAGDIAKSYDAVEAIRKSVKQVGKEEFYLRLTLNEKTEVNKVVYTFNELYSGEGRKTSANDIGRIAIHQLLRDYQENGEKSMLALVLAALNA